MWFTFFWSTSQNQLEITGNFEWFIWSLMIILTLKSSPNLETVGNGLGNVTPRCGLPHGVSMVCHVVGRAVAGQSEGSGRTEGSHFLHLTCSQIIKWILSNGYWKVHQKYYQKKQGVFWFKSIYSRGWFQFSLFREDLLDVISFVTSSPERMQH